MDNTSKISDRDIRYYRRLSRNRVFSEVLAYYAKVAAESGYRKCDIADALGKEPSQISRWFSEPANWTLDTVSDLLLALGAEMEFGIVPSVVGTQSDEEFMTAFKDWASKKKSSNIFQLPVRSPNKMSSGTTPEATGSLYNWNDEQTPGMTDRKSSAAV